MHPAIGVLLARWWHFLGSMSLFNIKRCVCLPSLQGPRFQSPISPTWRGTCNVLLSSFLQTLSSGSKLHNVDSITNNESQSDSRPTVHSIIESSTRCWDSSVHRGSSPDHVRFSSPSMHSTLNIRPYVPGFDPASETAEDCAFSNYTRESIIDD